MAVSSELPDLFGRATLVLGGHDDLRGMVTVLRDMSAALREDRPVSLDDVISQFAAFTDRVLSHFAAEESRDYFGTLAEQSPALEQSVVRLRSEHRQMTAHLTALRGFGDLRYHGPRFSRELDWVLDLLAEHERREHQLLAEFFGSGN